VERFFVKLTAACYITRHVSIKTRSQQFGSQSKLKVKQAASSVRVHSLLITENKTSED